MEDKFERFIEILDRDVQLHKSTPLTTLRLLTLAKQASKEVDGELEQIEETRKVPMGQGY